jgi:hypothetical protein
MTKKIESISGKEERYSRRDFSTIDKDGDAIEGDIDKYGNKVVTDKAGNKKLVAIEDGKETPDFSYQEKYNIKTKVNKDGMYKAEISILDDACIESLAEASKSILDHNSMMFAKMLPDGKVSTYSEEELTDDQKDSLEKLINIGEIIKQSKNICKEDTEIEDDNLEENSNKTENNTCHYCNHELIKGAKFCHNCGERNSVCSNCGEQISDDSNFCHNCGNKI